MTCSSVQATLRVILYERAKLPRGHAVAEEVCRGRDRGRAHAVVDERDLAEVVSRAERRSLLAPHADSRVALCDDEEAGAGRALGRHLRALGEAALVQLAGEQLELAVGQLGEEGHTLRRASIGAAIARIIDAPAGPGRDGGESRFRALAGRPLRRDRPRALLVGGGAARARAHEARPPAASLPGQVRAPARGGVSAPPRAAGAARLGSLRRLGHDARRGQRVRRARGRLRRLRVQLPAHAREDGRSTSRPSYWPTSSCSLARAGGRPLPRPAEPPPLPSAVVRAAHAR